MSLDLDVTQTLGAFRLRVALRSEAACLGITGPSGSGKTTLLNLVAGILRLETGSIAIDGRVLADTRHGLAVPPHRRGIGYVFQEARLFPHMTVRQNLLYGRMFAKRRRELLSYDRAVDLLGIGHLVGRRAVSLSGGEQQRIAIGRALLAAPRLLLFDEPLASLDERRREDILPLVARIRDEVRVPIVYVSHARDEIARLSQDVVTLEGGTIVDRTGARDGSLAM